VYVHVFQVVFEIMLYLYTCTRVPWYSSTMVPNGTMVPYGTRVRTRVPWYSSTYCNVPMVPLVPLPFWYGTTWYSSTRVPWYGKIQYIISRLEIQMQRGNHTGTIGIAISQLVQYMRYCNIAILQYDDVAYQNATGCSTPTHRKIHRIPASTNCNNLCFINKLKN
jgi:hypothetical protein